MLKSVPIGSIFPEFLEENEYRFILVGHEKRNYMVKKQAIKALENKISELNSISFFQKMQFNFVKINEISDDCAYSISNHFDDIKFYIDRYKAKDRFAFVYEISETISNKDLLSIPVFPKVWWISDETNKLKNEYFENIIFECNSSEIKGFSGNGGEINENIKKLFLKGNRSKTDRYISFYCKINNEKKSVRNFEKQIELFRKIINSIKELNSKVISSGRTDSIANKSFFVPPQEKGVGCEEIIIVGPYPTEGFVNRVINELKPSNIWVIADSTWKKDILEKISQIDKVCVVKVQTENGYGIVHAKMYCVKYSNGETQLYFGSVNASENSIDNNAEFISSYRLDAFSNDNQLQIRDYFENLKNKKDVGPIEVNLKNFSKLLFPQISVCKNETASSFVNWIRKGSFFVKYDADSNFGSLTINVKSSKLQKSQWQTLLEGTPLESDQGAVKTVLRFPYAKERNSAKKTVQHWKDKYGIVTEIGCWVSEECIHDHKDEIPPTNEARSKIVERIQSINDSECKKIADEFITSINTKDKRLLRQLIILPKNFADEIIKKREQDKILIQEKAFLDRYKSGYAQIPASALNMDFFESIINDFINTCIIKSKKMSKKQSSKSAWAKKLADQLFDIHNSPIKDKIKRLESLWKNSQEFFINYYK